jgi:allantoicase
MDGWMGGWMDGWESRVKDCLQQSKITFMKCKIAKNAKIDQRHPNFRQG